MLLELFKNAARAVVQRYPDGAAADGGKTNIPPVTLSVFSAEDETSFKITDKGIGIPATQQGRVWDYAYTTSQSPIKPPPADISLLHDLVVRPLGGEGFGLPMVRVYAQYFGGGVSLTSYPGHMTEVRLSCRHLDHADDLVSAFARSM